MKTIKLIPLLFFTMIIFQECKKIHDSEPLTKPVPMGELVIAPGFNWQTTRVINFVISYDNATMIYISSEDGNTVYHQGFFNRLTENYEISISLPAFIKNVVVNGQIVAISGSTISVSLATLKSSDLSHFQEALIPGQGLVSAWHFNENTGAAAADAQGVNNGVVSGALWVPGISGSALDFDGVAGQVLVPFSSTINNTTDQISLSCWFKMNQVGDDGAFLFTRVKYMLRLDAQGRVSFAIYNPDFKSVVMDYSDRILDTDWHHAVATYDGAEMKIFIDGSLKKTTVSVPEIR